MRCLVLLAALAACGDNVPGDIVIVTQQWQGALADFAQVGVTLADAPGPGLAIVVTDDAAIPLEGYRIDGLEVHAHDVLGAQYGVAATLEGLGLRFRHPYEAFVPDWRRPAADGALHQPQIRVRGLHLHTLHPVESHYAFWLGNTADAERIVDWVIWNRGNYVQWAALDDIEDPARHADWGSATRELIEFAHARGVRVGINIQLFSQASLQRAFTLVTSTTAPVADQIAARLPLVLDGLPFDVVDLSFGEFFDADPTAFIAAVNELARQLHALAPATELHALIHVGGTQRVTYQGENIPYYHLVKFADPSIIPDIHTVMYYDLFENAGGAYQMTDFGEQRQYLTDRMCAHQPAAYHPETAYWIAFDNSVPQLMPLYVRSRHYDLAQLRAAAPPPCGPLDEHLIFSSGWEWSYWLHDATALRASYELPDSPRDLVAEQLAPELPDAAPVISDLADLQHDALIGQHLAPYIASRDALIDAGRSIDIISQPDRVTFDDLVAGVPATFDAQVMTPLADYATALDALVGRLHALGLPGERWSRELADGLAIDAARAHFIHDAYATVLAHIAGDTAASKAARDRADSELATATKIVSRRHRDLHDRDPGLVTRGDNATVYGYGYLYFADQLCYWHRELAQVDAILGLTTAAPPACVL